MIKFPTDVLHEIKNRLRIDDLTILGYLEEQNAIAPQFSFSKDYIQSQIEEMTSAKTSCSLQRLEVACLIERQAFQKPQRFYITDNGKEVLKLINQLMEG